MTPEQITILKFVHRYVVCNRVILGEELLPELDEAFLRDLLRRHTYRGFLDRIEAPANDFTKSSAPVYMPTERGCCALADELQDMSFLPNSDPPRTKYQDIPHFLGVTRLFAKLTRGFAAQSAVELVRFFTEHHYLSDEIEQGKRKRLCTVFPKKGKGGGNVVCIPDAMTEIRQGGRTRADFWEFETTSTNQSRAVAKKSPGYELFRKERVFKQLCPDAAGMYVIFVMPGPAHRATMCRCLAQREMGEFSLVVARDDIKPDGKFITEASVFYPPKGEPRPLVAPPTSPPAAASGGATGGGVVVSASTS